jgi:hypothetical protein
MAVVIDGTNGVSSPDYEVDGVTGQIYPIVRGTAVASTSGTSIDFTSIPSWVRRITVVFDSVSLSGTDNILVQIGPSGAVETTGYVSASAYAISGAASGGASSTAGFIVILASSGNAHVGAMQLVNITGNTWIASCSGSYTTGTAAGVSGGGTKTLASGPLARLSITRTGTNTFDAGSINIMYE